MTDDLESRLADALTRATTAEDKEREWRMRYRAQQARAAAMQRTLLTERDDHRDRFQKFGSAYSLGRYDAHRRDLAQLHYLTGGAYGVPLDEQPDLSADVTVQP